MTDQLQTDPMINVFNMIVDRLSQLEETNDKILEHFRFEHMCKPYGFLNSALLGFPASMSIYLHKEFEKEPPGYYSNGWDDRPYLNSTLVSFMCDHSCTAYCPERSYSLYRKYFPREAASIIKFEEVDADKIVRLAQPKDFGIIGVRETIEEEVNYREVQKVMEYYKDKFQAQFVTMEEDPEFILTSKTLVTVQQHIQLALEILKSIGHTEKCITRMYITPFAPYVAELITMANDWNRLESQNKETKAKAIIKELKFTYARGISYLKKHNSSRFDDDIDSIRNMYEQVLQLTL